VTDCVVVERRPFLTGGCPDIGIRRLVWRRESLARSNTSPVVISRTLRSCAPDAETCVLGLAASRFRLRKLCLRRIGTKQSPISNTGLPPRLISLYTSSQPGHTGMPGALHNGMRHPTKSSARHPSRRSFGTTRRIRNRSRKPLGPNP